jgi:hypothetical protein
MLLRAVWPDNASPALLVCVSVQAKLEAGVRTGATVFVVSHENVDTQRNDFLRSFEAGGLQDVNVSPEVAARVQVYSAENVFEAFWACMRLPSGRLEHFPFSLHRVPEPCTCFPTDMAVFSFPVRGTLNHDGYVCVACRRAAGQATPPRNFGCG